MKLSSKKLRRKNKNVESVKLEDPPVPSDDMEVLPPKVRFRMLWLNISTQICLRKKLPREWQMRFKTLFNCWLNFGAVDFWRLRFNLFENILCFPGFKKIYLRSSWPLHLRSSSGLSTVSSSGRFTFLWPNPRCCPVMISGGLNSTSGSGATCAGIRRLKTCSFSRSSLS